MASISEDRIVQMEGAISRIEDGQRVLKWAGSLMVAIIIVVVGVNLARNFVLGDRLSDVRVEVRGVATQLEFVRENTSEIKGDLKALRNDVAGVRTAVDRISGAVGAPPMPIAPQEKTPPPKE